MNDFEGLLATDYGFKPQGKSIPMAASSKGPSNPSPANSVNFDLGSFGNSRSTKHSSSFGGSFPNDGDSIFAPTGSRKNQNLGDLDDFLGGSGKSRNKLESRQGDTDFNFDSIFRGSSKTGVPPMNSPNYDKPVYDDDIFDGVPGLKSSSKVKYDNVFVSSSSPSKRNAAFDDLLVGFGKAESVSNTKSSRKVEKDEKGIPAFDDFLRGFGGSSSPGDRTTSETKWSSEPTPAKTSFKPVEDPFMVSGNFSNPLDDISKVGSSAKISSTSAANNRVFEDVDPFAGLGKSVPAFSSEANNAKKDSSPSRVDMSSSGSQSSTNKPTTEKTSVRSPERFKPKKSVEYDSQTDQTLFDIPTSSSDSQKFVSRSASPPFDATTGSKDNNFHGNISPMFENNLDFSDDVWLTVSEIPLFTRPTSAPPPSRPPPPIPGQVPSSSTSMYSKKKTNEYSFPNYTGNFQASKFTPASLRASDVSPRDEFEEFSMGDSRSYVDGLANGLSNEEFEMNSAAAAMKETMDRAEAKFKHAKEVREREGTKPARSKEAGQLDEDKRLAKDERARRQERIDRERLQREKEKEEREKQRMERERERAREGEEREKQRMERERERAREGEEREKQRMERERERARDIQKEREEKDREQRRLEKERGLEVEREKARQLVERATREARERAAADARLRAERAAVDKIHAEARQRAERAAVQRAQTEARERAATEARERAEKAAAEARERANMEAKEREARDSVSARTEARARAERAAVERAAAEARERAATSAATAAASASARANQQRNENDLDSFFDMGNRASSAPRHRTAPSENFFDPQPQSQYGTETAKTASVSTSSMRKASSTTNIVDDLSSIFGAAPSSGDFQDVDGESEERRRARLERHQRTQERAAKALAEKNQRDLQILREQAERHRIAETLDIEIKRWAAGKEGNLRALLSTLQYVLWPECGWQPVSLTDLITGAAVKKVYRKATLCIHPDKVQQKGANLQQKYVAEKVFDILKEAWNKFNSEELF